MEVTRPSNLMLTTLALGARQRRWAALCAASPWIVVLASILLGWTFCDNRFEPTAAWRWGAWGAAVVTFVVASAAAFVVLRRGIPVTNIAAELETRLGLQHSELVSAVELLEKSRDPLAALAVERGEQAIVAAPAGQLSPRVELGNPSRVAAVMVALYLVCIVFFPMHTGTSLLRLAAPWTDMPVYTGLGFEVETSPGLPVRVQVTITSRAGEVPVFADLVRARTGFGGGPLESLATLPLRSTGMGRFEGQWWASREGESAAFYVSTPLGRSRVFTVTAAPARRPAGNESTAPLPATPEVLTQQLAELADAAIRSLPSESLKARRDRALEMSRLTKLLAELFGRRFDNQGQVQAMAASLNSRLEQLASRLDTDFSATATTSPVSANEASSAERAAWEAVRGGVQSLAGEISRLSQGEPAPSDSHPIGIIPGEGGGSGPGMGLGASEHVGGSAAETAGAIETGAASAATTSPTQAPDGAVADIPPRYRAMATDYLRRVAEDRGAPVPRH